MEHLQPYVYVIFGLTVLLTIWFFYQASGKSRKFLFILSLWITVQSALGLSGFYNDPQTMTVRFPLLILPPLVFLVSQLLTKRGKLFLDSLSLARLTILHIIRIPVELVLFWLLLANAIPEAMTFHGRNFDIFSGITAPIIYYFGFVTKQWKPGAILLWNLVCLLLLLNVVSSAILSLPSRYLQFGFEQPNIGLGFFPFILLPAVLVPLVLLSTVATIRQLLRIIKNKRSKSA